MNQDTQQVLHPSGTELFAQLIREKTTVSLAFPEGLSGASGRVVIEGTLIEEESNIIRFCIHPHNPLLFSYNRANALPALLPVELSFITTFTAANGASFLLHFSGSGKLLNVDYGADEKPSHFMFKIDDRLLVRRARRHRRLDWRKDMHANVGLGNVSTLPEVRDELRAHLANAFKEGNFRPEIVNISVGGVCLIVPEAYVSQPNIVPDGFLFVYTTAHAGERKLPTVLVSTQVGVRTDVCEAADRVALRLKFMQELDWPRSGEKLVWKDVSRSGSHAVSEFFKQFPKGMNLWKKR